MSVIQQLYCGLGTKEEKTPTNGEEVVDPLLELIDQQSTVPSLTPLSALTILCQNFPKYAQLFSCRVPISR